MTPDRNPSRILDMWATGLTAEDICDRTGYSRDAVFFHIRRARAAGDRRAARRSCQAPARRRMIKICILHHIGLEPARIASMVGLSKRMVQIRLKEMAT